ncbi:hypothetical protein HYT01_04185 [Candidatus Giovannonibacteria bacterium]|nr:hypothetical protein [Candidatus Giovannonibacteria bacterium]
MEYRVNLRHNLGHNITMEELERLRNGGPYGIKVNWSLIKWTESRDNGELDAIAKIDMIALLLLHCDNNPFRNHPIQVGFQIKLSKIMPQREAACKKDKKNMHKISERRLLHNYRHPLVPIIIVDPDKRGKLRRDLKAMFMRAAQRSHKILLIARARNISMPLVSLRGET